MLIISIIIIVVRIHFKFLELKTNKLKNIKKLKIPKNKQNKIQNIVKNKIICKPKIKFYLKK